MGKDVRNNIHRPAVSKYLISLGVRNRENIVVRHRLEPLALRHCQLADDIKSIGQLNGLLFAFNGNKSVYHFVTRHRFDRIFVYILNHVRDVRSGHGLRFPILKVDVCSLHSAVLRVSSLVTDAIFRYNNIASGRNCIQVSLCTNTAALAAQSNAFFIWRIYPVLLAVPITSRCTAFDWTNSDGFSRHRCREMTSIQCVCGAGLVIVGFQRVTFIFPRGPAFQDIP